VGGLEVGLGEVEVGADHFHSGVTEDDLEGVGIASIAEEADGEGVAKTVGVDVLHTGAASDGGELFEQAVAVHRHVVGGDEKRFGGDMGFPAGEIFPQRLGDARADGKDAFFGAFAEDFEIEVAGVQIGDAGLAQLIGAQAGIEQQENDGAVAVLIGELVAGGCAMVGVGLAAGEGREQGAQVFVAERLDRAFFGARALDLAQQVGVGQAFVVGEGPEGGEAGMVIEQRLFSDRLDGEESFELVFADLQDGWISGAGISATQPGGEFSKGDVVIVDRVWAEAAGLGGQVVAVDDLGKGERNHIRGSSG